MTWEQINAKWLVGGRIARTEAEVVSAFQAVEQTFGREWMETIRTRDGAIVTKSGPTLSVVVLGERLAALQGVSNTDHLLRRIREREPGADAELLTIYLLRGHDASTDVELEPRVESGRHPDFRIRKDAGPWTYVEVTQAQTSAAYRSVLDRAKRVASSDFPGKRALQYTIELFLTREPTQAEVHALIGRMPDFVRASSGSSIDLDTGLGRAFVNDATPGHVALQERGIGGSEPRIGVIHTEVEDGHAVRHVLVRLPFTDQRAVQFVRKEAKQLPETDPALIVIDTYGASGGFRWWEPLIRHRLIQARMHARVGGVVLLSQTGQVLTENGEDRLVELKPIWNSRAPLPLPPWLTARVDELARPGQAHDAV